MLDGLFAPRAVAVIGASENPLSIGQMVVKNLVAHHFAGAVYPIHPRAQTICGLPAYRALGEVPGPVDLVNIAVRRERLPAVLRACGEKGVRFAIVHTAGFGELGPAGQAEELALVALARQVGVRLYGPNSQGVQNGAPGVSLYANFTFVPMAPGSISIIAQSGGMGELFKLQLHRLGLGHHLYCSYGNEADVTMPELLDYIGADPGTRVILLQVERFKDPAAFLAAAAAITPRVPVLALASGRTVQGARAAASHTGALAGGVQLTRALLRKAGVTEFTDSARLVNAGAALALQPRPAGRRLAVLTNTGGPAIQAVDHAVEQGLELAQLTDAARARLRAALLPQASCENPLDLVATARPEHFQAALQIVLAEAGVDAVLVFFVTAPFVDHDEIAARLAEVARTAQKPVVAVVETLAPDAPSIRALRAAGLPVFELPEAGALALADLARAAERCRRPAASMPWPVDRAVAKEVLARACGGWLSQHDAFALLAAYGIAAPPAAAVRKRADLEAAAAQVGFPCVLKADHPQVIHKLQAGGLALHLDTPAALAAAFAALAARMPPQAAFLLQRQLPVAPELIVGAQAGPAGVGPLVLVGLGGTWAEALAEVVTSIGPLGAGESRELVDALGSRVLAAAGLNSGALAELVGRVSQLAADWPQIQALDLNPVVAGPDGRPLVLDVRLQLG